MSPSSMPDLRCLIEQLRREGDLEVIDPQVDPHLEIAEIHRRVIAADGPALLFTNVKGADFPLVSNLFGASRRIERAFGTRPEEFIRRLVEVATGEFVAPLKMAWGARDVVKQGLQIGFKNLRRGPVMECVQPTPRLDRLPALTSWSEDAGPFVTLPLVYTEHPEGRGHNLGMYRLQIYDQHSTGMHWQIGKGGGFHYAVAEELGQDLPVTVFLGGPPALIVSAIAPLPENVPELLLASLLCGQRLRRCQGPGDHLLVADAEFALVGRVRPRQRRPEGPFGDHYGYYSLQHEYPVLEVDVVAHRRDAIYPATVVGKPRQEDFFIGDYLQKLLEPLIRLVMPAVEDLWSYGETGYHALASAVVKQRYGREAMTSAFRILGEGQLALTKFLLLTDQDVDLSDFKAVLEHILERTDPRTDLYIFSNLSMDTLDYTGPKVNHGSKGVWLGMGDPVRELPRRFETSELAAGVGEVRVFCGGCLVVDGPKFDDEPGFAERIAQHQAFQDWQLVVISDNAERATKSSMNFLWTTFTRFEPAADIVAGGFELRRSHICYEFPIVIDARMKPPYPRELHCDPVTSELVSSRWNEYFGGHSIAMGDSERGHLD